MRQDHASDDERPEAKLVGCVDHAHPPDGPTPMGQAELRRDEQKVALLLLADHPKRDCRPLGEPQVLRTELALAVVVESPRLAAEVKDLLDGLVVGLGDFLPARNRKPAFRASPAKRGQLLGTRQHRTDVETVEK